jgi:hypothetical protein
MRNVGIVVVVLVFGIALLNAIFMLISPSKWFDLPGWTSMRGYFNREMYREGWGAAQVRLAGLLISALIGYVLFSMIRGR